MGDINPAQMRRLRGFNSIIFIALKDTNSCRMLREHPIVGSVLGYRIPSVGNPAFCIRLTRNPRNYREFSGEFGHCDIKWYASKMKLMRKKMRMVSVEEFLSWQRESSGE